jgi:predicted P-loop ATPase
MNLTPEHAAHLDKELGEGGAALAAAHGARSIDAEEANRLGFRWGGHRTGGLLLPFAEGFAQLRCDDPPIAANGDPVKYLNRAGLKQAPATFGKGDPTIATEGWKDALSLHHRTGETAQAVPGVTGHKAIAGTVTRLVYDADAAHNPAVWSQLVAASIQRRILRVGFFPEAVAGPKGGACEFFANGGDFESIAWWKARALLAELPKGWNGDMRPDWKPHTIRHVARLAIKAGYGKDTARQMAVDAARIIKITVQEAREIVAKVRREAATPPPAPDPGEPLHKVLMWAAGKPVEGQVDAGGWRNCLHRGLGDRLRRNLLTQQVELDGVEIPAESESLLYVWAQSEGWKISKPDCYDGTRALAIEHSYHPVREYLDRVADDQNIDAADLEAIAEKYLGVSDGLSAAMVRCLLVGAVARIHQPGCVAPGVVVLRGDQGIGKSGFWSALAGDFYVVSREHDNNKDQTMAMHRSWFYDMDELDKVTTASKAASLRSLITTPADTFRAPYAPRQERFPRQFVIVGAVNGDGFLTDPEGNRRYWVINCPQKKDSGEYIDGPGAACERDSIWKAAVLAYRRGNAWTLTAAEQKASNDLNRQWEVVDEWQAALETWATRTVTPEGFTTREAIAGAGLRRLENIDKGDEMRAAAALKRAGFKHSKSLTTRDNRDGTKTRDRFWSIAAEHLELHRTTSETEVVQPQTAGSIKDLPPAEQPEQPLRGPSRGTERAGLMAQGDAPMTSESEVLLQKVAQVVQQAPADVGRPVLVDGQPGWRLPGAMPKGSGPTVRVLVVDPHGCSRQVERKRIAAAPSASAV